MVASGATRTELYIGPPISDQVEAAFRVLADRRRSGVPLQYLEETVPFGPLELFVDTRALIPRPETEQMWELVVGLADEPELIVDLGTGSGNLALSLKHGFPQATVYGCDISEASLDLARLNGKSTGLEVVWAQGDLFAALPASLQGKVDLIVSNPPYVSEREYEALSIEVKDHEPRVALVGGPAGTEVLERIARDAPGWLCPRGLLVVEIGESQGETIGVACRDLDFQVRRDLADKDRFVTARKPGSRRVAV